MSVYFILEDIFSKHCVITRGSVLPCKHAVTKNDKRIYANEQHFKMSVEHVECVITMRHGTTKRQV